MTVAKIPEENKSYLKNTVRIDYKVCPGRGEIFHISD